MSFAEVCIAVGAMCAFAALRRRLRRRSGQAFLKVVEVARSK